MQDKNVKVTGTANAQIDSDSGQLNTTPKDGLVSVAICDARGLVVWMHHPLAGWYTEIDTRRPDETEEQSA